MAIQSSNKDGIFNEINITPLTDIFLVLLIIMMVIAPMFQTIDQNIKVPEINSGLNVEDSKVNVAVTENASYYINGEKIDPALLEQKLSELFEQAKDKTVVVKADVNTKNSEIMKIMRAAQATGYEKLTVAGEPLSKKQQAQLEDRNKSNNINVPE